MLRSKPQISAEEYGAKLERRGETIEGREIVSNVPLAPPIGYVKQPSMIENIRNMVRSEMLRQAATEKGLESFEEADDFDVPDELEPISGYENDAEFEPPAPPPSSSSESSTGVPPPLGGGKGGGDSPPISPAPEEAQEQGTASPEPPKPVKKKPAPGPL